MKQAITQTEYQRRWSEAKENAKPIREYHNLIKRMIIRIADEPSDSTYTDADREVFRALLEENHRVSANTWDHIYYTM